MSKAQLYKLVYRARITQSGLSADGAGPENPPGPLWLQLGRDGTQDEAGQEPLQGLGVHGYPVQVLRAENVAEEYIWTKVKCHQIVKL